MVVRIFCLLMFVWGVAAAQPSVQRVVPIVKEQTFYINSRLKPFGERTMVVPIDLPKHTVAWYYSFASTPNENTVVVNLTAELTRIVDRTGIGAGVIKSLTKPSGANICEVYVLDSLQVLDFKAGKKFGYDQSIARTNYSAAVVDVNSVRQGRVYLCFVNPSTLYGTHIKLQVAAVIQNALTREQKDMFYGNLMKSYLGRNDAAVRAVCACMVEKFALTHSQDDIEQLASSSWEYLYQTYRSECSKETNNEALEAEFREVQQQLDGFLVGDKNFHEKNYELRLAIADKGYIAPEVMESLAWSGIVRKEFKEVILRVVGSLRVYPDAKRLRMLLGYAYLFEGDTKEGLELLRADKDYVFPDGTTWLGLISNDLRDFKVAKLSDKKLELIRTDILSGE